MKHLVAEMASLWQLNQQSSLFSVDNKHSTTAEKSSSSDSFIWAIALLRKFRNNISNKLQMKMNKERGQERHLTYLTVLRVDAYFIHTDMRLVSSISWASVDDIFARVACSCKIAWWSCTADHWAKKQTSQVLLSFDEVAEKCFSACCSWTHEYSSSVICSLLTLLLPELHDVSRGR